MLASAGDFFRWLGAYVVSVLPWFVMAWLLTWVVLVLCFQQAKARMRPRIINADDEVRAWAKTLRFRVASQASASDETREAERHALTWFFRFWTNFASAPSLSIFSLAIPLWWFLRQDPATFQKVHIWLLPGLCYAGSMYLSYTLKRVFRRVRPQRVEGAFGHKLKDGSFPSGHSLTSFCFWFMLTISLALAGVAMPLVVLFGVLALAIVLLTGLSRIYLGVHFPSDVAGGYIIGLVWCAACLTALYGRL